ncbi:MAG: hypothetical protein ACREEP_20350, partial [Dongiaceae bacterium]
MRQTARSSFKRVEIRKPGKSPVKGRKFDALKDVPDIRDRMYEPTLLPLKSALPPPRSLFIMNQGNEGACTGFGLAATVNLLLGRNWPAARSKARRVSPNMLYLMARRHDEWPGEKDEGSSLRGALRGFYNCGACQLDLWKTKDPGNFSLGTAKDARETALGAYYRLRPNLSDYHAAINETGVVYASAAVHRGWDDPMGGEIEPQAGSSLHAFAIVGYDAQGFWVQNSWGPKWGKGGLAHWPYKDWAANIEDAWVLQLAVRAPDAFGLGVSRSLEHTGAEVSRSKRAKPARQDIAGHFVHVDNGKFSDAQPYWSDKKDVAATAELIGRTGDYDHLLFYAHGGLNAPEEAAIRVAAMSGVFKTNRIYPYSVLYDTGLLKTLKEIIQGTGAEINRRTGGLLDVTDRLIEEAVGGVGTRLWDAMKADASTPFKQSGDGTVSLKLFVDQFAKRAAQGKKPLKIHLVGHSTGAILIGHLLAALDGLLPAGAAIDSCLLMAPACRIDFFQANYRPRLGGAASAAVKIKQMKVYNLTDQAEQDDQVTPAYNKSLLYLVSNAFEPQPPKPARMKDDTQADGQPLLGMQKFKDKIGTALVDIAYA